MDGGLVSSASCSEHQECTWQSETGLWLKQITRNQEGEAKTQPHTPRLKQRWLYWLAPSGHNIDWSCTGQIPVCRGLSWGYSSQFPIGSSRDSGCKRPLPVDEATDYGCTGQGYIMSACHYFLFLTFTNLIN